jgi:glutamate-1-semialdehyde aminotransferase
MTENGGLPNFSYQYKSNNDKIKKISKQSLKPNLKIDKSAKKTRFVSTDMTKVNIADVLSFIKQEEKTDNILAEFQNLDIVSDL